MQDNRIIAAAIHARKAWEIVRSFEDNGISLEEELGLSDISLSIFREISNYYSDNDADKVDKDVLLHVLKKKYRKNRELLEAYFDNMPEAPPVHNIIKILQEQYKEIQALDITALIHAGKLEEATYKMREFLTTELPEQEEQEEQDILVGTPLSALAEASSYESLITIYPSILNKALGGGLPRQSQIGIVARPDVGKTAIAMNLTVPALEDGHTVLYIGNEDADSRMLTRVMCRLCRVTKEELFSNPEKYQKLALDKGYNNFVFAGAGIDTLGKIEKVVDKYKPDIVVVDQLRNIRLHNKDASITEILEKGAKTMRKLAKTHDFLSVLVTQAGESAENKLVLTMTDVEYSNTGFAGALDLMIGAGQDIQYKQYNRLMLSFPKNKLTAPLTPMPVKIDYERNMLLSNTQEN